MKRFYDDVYDIFEEEIYEKNKTRAKTRKNREYEKKRNKSLAQEYECAVRNVHKKRMSKRKPRGGELGLREALAEFYGL